MHGVQRVKILLLTFWDCPNLFEKINFHKPTADETTGKKNVHRKANLHTLEK